MENKVQWEEDYAVVSTCTGCGKCIYVCKEGCIVSGSVPYYIDPVKCVRCGACAEVCPVDAIKLI